MRNKIKRYVSILCLLSLFVGLIKPINKVEAVTPDAPNLKTLSQLNEGDSVFFADMEWIVLNPDEGKLIARKSIFELPNFNLNKSSWSIDSYDKALSFLRNDFYNKINLEEKKLITKKPDFPQEEELKKLNSNTKNLITTECDKVAIRENNKLKFYTYGHVVRAEDDYDKTHGNYNTFTYEQSSSFHNIDQSYSAVKPVIFVSPSAKIFFDDSEDIVLVLGGKYNLSSPKGTTNKFYFYDRYLIEPKYSAIEGTYKFVYFKKVHYKSGDFDNAVTRYKSNYYNTPFYRESNFNGKYYSNGSSLSDWDILDSYMLRNFNIYNFSSNGTSVYKSGYPGGGYSTIYDDNYVWSGLYWTKRVCISYLGITKGQQAGSYFLGKDNQYPINGPHSDGYWYVRREEANIEGLGEVDIDNLSQALKYDIMPVLNVIVNKDFDEVVQGRGYLGNTSGSVSGKLPDGEFSIVKQDERYVKVRGKFTSTGVKFAEAVGKDGKSAYFLFNVMDDPSPTSAKGVVFTDSKPKAEFSIIRKGVNYTDNISSPFITSEPTIELELIDKSAPYYDIVKWEWCIWDGQNWKVISRSKDVKYTVSSSDSIATFKLKVTNSKGVESNSITHCMYISK